MLTAYPKISLFRKKKNIYLALSIFICILLLSDCISKSNSTEPDIRGENYAGSLSCKKCHQQIYDAFIQTAHANTSSSTLPSIVVQAFEKGRNVFEFNDTWKVVMEKKEDQYYQTAYENGIKADSHPFDMVIGSGRKAQTYFYYDSNKFFQLPLSYFMAEHTWANSPGFPAEGPKFNRSIPSGCFGCHSSFISVKQSYSSLQLNETYQKDAVIYGIDCERCHGPAQEHVNYYTDHPGDKQIKFITRISTLNRSQKTDMCALCHSGVKETQQSMFGFRPGDSLVHFYFPDFDIPDAETMDVHGKQSILMMGSKCYRLTNDLTCNSCHNVHVKEREGIALFSQRCITCHQHAEHSFTVANKTMAGLIQTNCIDCHMPLRPSKKITLLTKQQTSAKPDYIRTHLIKIYPVETKQFLDSLKQELKTPL